MACKFKHTEIGIIPGDWGIIALGEGLSLLKDGSHNPPKRVKSGIRFIAGASDIKYLNIDFSDCTYITEKDYNHIHKYYKIQENDVLLTIVGTVGNVAIVKKEDLPFSLQRSIAILRCGEKIDHRFLFYWLTSPRFRQLLSSRLNPTAQPGIYLGELGKLTMPLPPLPTQRAIAKTLSDLDKKIELNRQMSKTLESIAQAIFKHWFVDFEFPGENGEPYKSSGGDMVESELGQIPKDWRCERFGSIISRRSERVAGRDVVILSAMASGSLARSDDHFTKRVYSKKIDNYLLVEKWDFAYNPARINIGSIGMLEEHILGGVSPVYVVIRPKLSFHWFLRFCMRRGYIKTWINTLASGSVRQSLSYSDFASIPCVIPPKVVTQEFNKIYSIFHTSHQKFEKEIRHLVTLRDALLPKLMSGKIRVAV